jgi:methionyl-tRNA formyltransferase
MSSTKRIAVFGCKSTTEVLLKCLLALGKVDALITIDPEKGKHFEVADYNDLRDFASLHDIHVYSAEKYSLKSDTDYQTISDLNIDLAFVMGWQRLIPGPILEQFSVGAFGMHGSAANLPKGRGRSPMNWSIIEGKKSFYTNLFKYDAGADSGNVLDFVKFTITDQDTGETMHYKNTLSMEYLIRENYERLCSGNLKLKKQANQTPTYYPKRSPEDSLIDWQDDVQNVERLIRAVTKPFNGAYCFSGNNKVIIYRAQIFDLFDFGFTQEDPGTIVEIYPSGKFLIKGQGGLLLVNEYESDVKLQIGDVLSTGKEQKRYFPRNQFGGFDLEE